MISDVIQSSRRVESTPEVCLIADLLVDPSRSHEIAGLSGSDFQDSGLGSLFDAVRILIDADFPVTDGGALARALRRMQSVPEDVRDPVFIAGLYRQGMGYHVRHHAETVLNDSRARMLRDVANRLLMRLDGVSVNANEAVEWLESQLQLPTLKPTSTVEPAEQVAKRIVAAIVNQPVDTSDNAMTGLQSVDSVVGAWHAGEVVVIAARPGMGKSAMATQIAMHQAKRGRRTLFVSLEMSSDEIVKRRLCEEANVNSRLIRNGQLGERDRQSLERSSGLFDGLPLMLWSPPCATLAQIRAIARREAASDGLACLIIDYMQLIVPASKKSQRQEQVAEISREIKQLARELRVPCFVLAQLNREADSAEPRLSHLRESGAIEADADGVMMLHRKSADADKATIIMAKNRSGAIGDIEVGWDAVRTRFYDITTAVREPAFDLLNKGKAPF